MPSDPFSRSPVTRAPPSFEGVRGDSPYGPAMDPTRAAPSEKSPLGPAHPLDEEETILWEGDGQLSSQDQAERTRLILRWKPDVEIVFHQPDVSSDELAVFATVERDTRLRLLEEDIEVRVLLRNMSPPMGLISGINWGSSDDVRRLRFHQVNFPNVLLPTALHESTPEREAYWRGSMTAHGGPWRLRLDTRRDISNVIQRIQEDQSYGVTHIGELSRGDGQPFSGEAEIRSGLRCLLALFSFCRGAWSAPMLPVGYDNQNDPVWWSAGSVFCTAGLVNGLSWLDPHDGEGLQEVASLWMELWHDPLWAQALDRATMYYTEANRQGLAHPSFLEIRYTLAQAGLELMAWTILRQEAEATTPGWATGRDAAPKNLRNVLSWAGISVDVPPELPALEDLRMEKGWDDAAHVPSWLRNRIAHPKVRAASSGPAHDVLWQGTQLAIWYLELLLLRRLGYNGSYGCRLETDRSAGQTRLVPWVEHHL